MKKMNRAQEIDRLLKFIYRECKKSNIQINEEVVYGTLLNYGFNAQEVNIHTESLFPMWIDRFKNKSNLDVFHCMQQSHFLQFHNGRSAGSKHLKLYVSLAPNAYYEGVNTIFDFIEKNNMKTTSKVANKIRSDEIVLRMESTDDAEKLINFINGNSFLTQNARKTNPFLNREGIVGIGYDDLLSYNSTVSFFISDYLNKTNNPNYEEFVNYLNNKYINLFQNQIELRAFTQSNLFKSNLARIKSGFSMINNPELYVINNYRIVFGVILNNIYGDSYKNIYGCIDESKDIFNKMTGEDKYKIFDDYIRYAYEKYNHDIDMVAEALYRYSKSEVNAITRDNGFRDKFIYNINPNKVMAITNNDIISYINTTLSIDNTISFSDTLNQTKDLNKPEDFDIFIEALRETYNKYGVNQLLGSINEILRGNFNVITNGSFGYRKYFTSKYDSIGLTNLANQFIDILLNGRTINMDEELNQVVFEILQNNYGFVDNNTYGKSR